MADLPDSIGYLTVTARAVLGLADSNDAGTEPDMVPAVATVKFTPNFRGPDPLIAVAEGLMILAQPIICQLDANGRLVPPSDGVGSAPDPGAPNTISLIAPNQLALNLTDWTWTATLSPAGGQTWQPFSRVFTGAPGDAIDLAVLVATTPAAGVLQALIYEVATTAEPYPTGFRVGVDYLLTPDGNLWKVTA